MATSSQAARPRGYEKSDANPRGLLYFVLIMAAILAATSLALIGLFRYLQRAQNPGSFVAAPFSAIRPIPPAPRIQSNPGADMQSYFQSQQSVLNTYGWIDRQNGIVRLPIDRAVELLLERGLPTRTTGASEKQPPTEKGNRAGSAAQEGGSLR